MNIVKSDLNFKFSEIEKEKETSNLFVRIADYGRYVLDNKVLDAIGERGSEIDFNEVVTNWHKNLLDDPENEMLKYKDLAYEQMVEADKYYQENDLKNDLISRLLSKFSKSYPKNI